MSLKKLLMPLIKEHASSLTPCQLQELLNVLINIHNDPNNILIPLKGNKFDFVNSNEILYIEQPKNTIINIALQDRMIEYKNTACDLLGHVSELNGDFRYLYNNRLLVNMSKIVAYNSWLRRVQFANGKQIDITGAAMNNIIIKRFGKELDLYQNSELKKQVECY